MVEKVMEEIGFGGGCHWCTEAIFRSLMGVSDVQQGWISPAGASTMFSEAVLVRFNPHVISLDTLVAVHLHTHSCTSAHAMRSKYRSAIYIFDEDQAVAATASIRNTQPDFQSPILTEVLPFGSFRLNQQEYLDYYYSNPEKPFCKTYIDPKLKILMDRFSEVMK